MNYKMNVTLYDPANEADTMTFDLKVEFACDPKQYGNGYSVAFIGKQMPFGMDVYDIRYDTSFHRDHKEEWITAWAHSHWTGKNGAWAIRSLTIEKVAA